MKEYKFWGWQTADVKPLGKTYPFEDPRQMYDYLTRCWGADTCAPRLRDKWSPANMTEGQCSITAFLVQDIFGGEVYGIRLPDGAYHCYNVVGEVQFDLTSEQFGDEVLDYTQGVPQSREEHFADQDKFGTNSTLQPTPGYVGLTFKHPFARVCFKQSEANSSNVKINSVTVSGIKNNGTCTFDGSTIVWTPSGDATALTVSGIPATNTPATGNDFYLVVPQTFASNITFTVNATWTDWSNVTKNVSATVNVGSWVAGYSYTYTLTLDKFALTVDAEKFTEQW